LSRDLHQIQQLVEGSHVSCVLGLQGGWGVVGLLLVPVLSLLLLLLLQQLQLWLMGLMSCCSCWC